MPEEGIQTTPANALDLERGRDGRGSDAARLSGAPDSRGVTVIDRAAPPLKSVGEWLTWETNMPNGAWSLREWPLPLIRVKCDKCGRVGQYHTAKLIEQHEIGRAHV